ncbi:MAG: sigma-E processing peptidase SpoIIGA [Brotaphodocola sp.]
MTVTLYLDVYLTVNLLTNLALLRLVNWLLKLHGKGSRMFLAALFGALAACVWLIFLTVTESETSRFLGRLLFLTGICAGMLRIAFGKMKSGTFWRSLAGFWIAAAAVGGFFEVIFDCEERSFFHFLCCVAGVYCGGKAVILFLQREQSLQKNLYEVTLYYQGNCTKVTALLDSGNRLYEPYGHQPVHVVSDKVIRELCHTCNHMIYIPFSSVGTEHGVLPGMRMDNMEVRKDGRLVRSLKHPWVAISSQPLSVGRKYEMLLHGEEE